MALDPNIILQANNFPKMDVGQTLQLREIVGARRSAEAEAQRTRQLAAAAQQRRQTIGGLAAQGDYTGARTAALGAGDFDLADAVGKMDETAKAKALAKTQAGASVLFAAGKQPMQSRAAVIAAAAPTLAQQGYTPEEIAKLGADLSDEGIAGNLAGALTLTQQLEMSEKAADRALRASEAQATREFQRGNAYISAGIMPPGEGAGVPRVGGGDTFGRMLIAESNGRQFTADGKPVTSPKGAVGIAQVMPSTGPEAARYAGVAWDPDRFRTDAAYNEQLGRAYFGAMVERFGGDEAKAVAAYNAGPGRVEKAVRSAGANWAQVLPRETRDYLAKVGGDATAVAGVTNIIPGGKLDRQRIADERADAREARADAREARAIATANGKEAMTLRKEFDTLPEVKKFKTVRTAAQQVRSLGGKKDPTATDDIALIFSYMRMLDPDSVVREGEFATAQNAAGVPDQIRNLYNRAKDGTRLTPGQRQNMIASAGSVYAPLRGAYNDVARKYRGYAEAAGIDPAKVAYVATPDSQRQRGTLSPRGRPAARAVPSDIAAILEKYR